MEKAPLLTRKFLVPLKNTVYRIEFEECHGYFKNKVCPKCRGNLLSFVKIQRIIEVVDLKKMALVDRLNPLIKKCRKEINNILRKKIICWNCEEKQEQFYFQE